MSTKSRILILLFSSTYISLFSQGLFEGKIKYAVSVETFQDDHPWNKYLEKNREIAQLIVIKIYQIEDSFPTIKQSVFNKKKQISKAASIQFFENYYLS